MRGTRTNRSFDMGKAETTVGGREDGKKMDGGEKGGRREQTVVEITNCKRSENRRG